MYFVRYFLWIYTRIIKHTQPSRHIHTHTFIFVLNYEVIGKTAQLQFFTVSLELHNPGLCNVSLRKDKKPTTLKFYLFIFPFAT